MKKNLYFRAVYKRPSMLITNLFNILYAFSTLPRMILEIFIRKNMGERYFRLSHAIFAGLSIYLVKALIDYVQHSFMRSPLRGVFQPEQVSESKGDPDWLIWTIFWCAYIVFIFIRASESKQQDATFDFQRFSLSSGESVVFQWLYKANLKVTYRDLEIVFEPLFFAAIGLFLALIGSSLGWVILVCAGFYSFSYLHAYQVGDDFVLDKIDEMIVNKNLKDAFSSDDPDYSKDGFRFVGRKPFSREEREKLSDNFYEQDDDPNAESL